MGDYVRQTLTLTLTSNPNPNAVVGFVTPVAECGVGSSRARPERCELSCITLCIFKCVHTHIYYRIKGNFNFRIRTNIIINKQAIKRYLKIDQLIFPSSSLFLYFTTTAWTAVAGEIYLGPRLVHTSNFIQLLFRFAGSQFSSKWKPIEPIQHNLTNDDGNHGRQLP